MCTIPLPLNVVPEDCSFIWCDWMKEVLHKRHCHLILFFLQATSLINIMKNVGESIVHHIKYYVQLGPDDGKEKGAKPLKHTLPIHRMAVVNLATFLVQFLESLVPLEMVRTNVV